jgi:hypothetical protein
MKQLLVIVTVLFFSCTKKEVTQIQTTPLIRPVEIVAGTATKVIINGYEYAKVDYQLTKLDDVVRVTLPNGSPNILPVNSQPSTLYVKLDSVSRRGVVNFQYKMKDSSNMASIYWQYFY